MPLDWSSSSVSMASVFWPTRAMMSWHDKSLHTIWSFTPFTAGAPPPCQPRRSRTAHGARRTAHGARSAALEAGR